MILTIRFRFISFSCELQSACHGKQPPATAPLQDNDCRQQAVRNQRGSGVHKVTDDGMQDVKNELSNALFAIVCTFVGRDYC